jgi:DnaJ-class molecular chaperone
MAKYEICPTCEGEGTTVHAALSVWTESDRAEDPEGFETMMGGGYDVICPECSGTRVVSTKARADYRERLQDARTMAAENGDWEGYSNPRLYLS